MTTSQLIAASHHNWQAGKSNSNLHQGRLQLFVAVRQKHRAGSPDDRGDNADLVGLLVDFVPGVVRKVALP